MKEYVTLSLETHLFFGRIMKEHSLFLLAGFPAKETEFIKRADRFREEFEAGLRRTVELADDCNRIYAKGGMPDKKFDRNPY